MGHFLVMFSVLAVIYVRTKFLTTELIPEMDHSNMGPTLSLVMRSPGNVMGCKFIMLILLWHEIPPPKLCMSRRQCHQNGCSFLLPFFWEICIIILALFHPIHEEACCRWIDSVFWWFGWDYWYLATSSRSFSLYEHWKKFSCFFCQLLS